MGQEHHRGEEYKGGEGASGWGGWNILMGRREHHGGEGASGWGG